ncbi:MAG: bifunctional diaminohydroxyphosphoribosylaminopyrimidine deaminase/5-amino-6-(5-phosphoribosylamino)uracil reductase RibD [Muribaculaceae bacterium]|nr:bifunctional diaminohydroxyphosphoribosylaminopyrimidine deaminase/5-amino-6-(5-phosphoribosylamino)uracil reductase RibD [Muribaculaceae bacterium]
MQRALQLARLGEGFVSPNPMVGAVIVHRGKIIGEGYHRRYGEGHAEVNAVASVADCSLLRESTIYVTLEPCSHYGKTPSCAKLLVECGFRRVVIGCIDPTGKVNGRGVAMLREAGIDVTTDVLRDECLELNRVFIVSHKLRRPYIILKWAMSADGYMDSDRVNTNGMPERFSTAASSRLVHLLRSRCDAIMVGSGTVMADDPRLDVRGVTGRSPLRVVVDRRGRIPIDAAALRAPSVYVGPEGRISTPGVTTISGADMNLGAVMASLYDRGVTSVLVEGGHELLCAAIKENMWDECRVEVSPRTFGNSGLYRMSVPSGVMSVTEFCGTDTLISVKNPRIEAVLSV